MNLYNSPVSRLQLTMTVGAVLGVLVVIVPVLPLFNLFPQIAGMFTFFCGIYFSIKYFRKQSGGCVSFYQAWITGTGTAFFTSLILAFIMYITAKIIDPSLIDLSVERIGRIAQSSGMPDKLQEAYMQAMQEMITPVFMAFSTIFSNTVTGTLMACISAYMLKNTTRGNNQLSNQNSNI